MQQNHIYLRNLDVDDLFILSSLLDHPKLNWIAKTLRLTPPAIAHRLRKYREHIPEFELSQKSNNSGYTLSEKTEQFCIKARRALKTLER